jgi:hypothetical protein
MTIPITNHGHTVSAEFQGPNLDPNHDLLPCKPSSPGGAKQLPPQVASTAVNTYFALVLALSVLRPRTSPQFVQLSYIAIYDIQWILQENALQIGRACCFPHTTCRRSEGQTKANADADPSNIAGAAICICAPPHTLARLPCQAGLPL